MHQIFKNKTKAGFTLIEILITVSIFAVVSILTVGAFLSLSSVQRKTQGSQEILNEIRFSVDLMAQEILSGSAFPNGCTNGCDNIVFASKVRPDMPLRRVEYYLDAPNGIIMKGEQKTFGECAVIPLQPDCFQPFTSNNVYIDNLQFFIDNTGANEQLVTNLVIQGTILPGTKYEDTFEISNSVSPRMLQDPNAMPPADNEAPVIEITQPTTADTYDTNATSLILQGTASDNVAVTETRWRNETTSQSGFLVGLAAWTSPAIDIAPSVTNILVVEARDADGNIGTDTLQVNSSAPPGPPEGGDLSISDGCAFDIPYVHLDWDEIENIDYYEISKCQGAGCTPLTAVDTTTNTAWYDWTVVSGLLYRYSIRSHHPLYGFSSYSDPVEITVNNCPVPPPPALTVVSDCDAGGNERAYLNWPSESANYYEVYKCLGALCDPQGDGSMIATPSSSYYYDNNVTVGQFYNYQIIPVNTLPNPDIYGTPSNIAGVTIVVCGPPPPPGAPVISVSSECNIEDEYIYIDWPSISGADYYEIHRCTGVACSLNTPLGAPFDTTTSSNYHDPMNDPGDIGITYRYRVVAVDTDPNPNTSSSPSNIAGAIVVLCPPYIPPPPSDEFTLTAIPEIIKVGVSGNPTVLRTSTKSRITVNPSGGFVATVSLSSSGGPTGITPTFNPGSIDLPNYALGSDYSVTIPDSTPTGVYTLVVTGNGGGETDDVDIYLDVYATGGGQE